MPVVAYGGRGVGRGPLPAVACDHIWVSSSGDGSDFFEGGDGESDRSPARPIFTLDGKDRRRHGLTKQFDGTGRLDAAGRRPEIDLYKSRGLDLTPKEIKARRSNRRIMAGFILPSIVILVLALIATAIHQSNEPSGPKQTAPADYQVQNDGHFSYLIPKDWSNNPLFTDSDGDLENSGKGGFAGERIQYRLHAPTLGEAQPSSLAAFGMNAPEPYRLSAGHAITVPGAASTFEYTMTRPGGFHAVVVDSWDAQTDVELWLIVDAPQDVTTRIMASLKA